MIQNETKSLEIVPVKRKRGMPKGVSGNPNGRPRGLKNKKTLQLEQFAEHVSTVGMPKFLKELNKLEGKSYVDAYLQLFEFVRPKLARAELTGADGKDLDFRQVFIIAGKEIQL